MRAVMSLFARTSVIIFWDFKELEILNLLLVDWTRGLISVQEVIYLDVNHVLLVHVPRFPTRRTISHVRRLLFYAI